MKSGTTVHTRRKTPKEIAVTDAVYLDSFRIRITFSDGTSRIIDLAEFLSHAPNPVFKKYRLKQNFKKFRIVNGNLNWNDYEMIFPIVELYDGRVL